MAQIERLETIETLKALKARYFLHLDRQDWASWRKVFAADAVMDVSSQFPDAPDPSVYIISGVDSIVAMVSSSLTGVVTAHHGHTPLVTIENETSATGIWAMEDSLFMPDGSRLTGYGHYEERYSRIDGIWRIAFTRLVRLKLLFTPAPAIG